MFTFGSGVFGQLGNGSTTKITSPVPVYGLPESIKCISTAYFHNVSITNMNISKNNIFLTFFFLHF